VGQSHVKESKGEQETERGRLGMVAHIYNPSYMAGTDWEDSISIKKLGVV
jgi:hypothetical protein